jgi:hypothetical protein
MKIHIAELNKHRNETTFRPYLAAAGELARHGIQFVNDEYAADVVFVGQASIIDKKKSLEESARNGLAFLKNINRPFVVFDGQDSSSLIGTWDVCKNYSGLKLVKNVILNSTEDYKNKYENGRWFWGKSECGNGGYGIDDVESLKDSLILSGVNWLNTYGNGFSFNGVNKQKKYDVAIMIGISPENYEHGIRTDDLYNESRKNLFGAAKNLKCRVVTTEKTGKLNRNEYLDVLHNSKFCISPFGYGEINIREIESLMTGTVIIKPSISNVMTKPWIYGDGMSLTCKPDYSDLVEMVETYLSDYYNFAEGMLYEQHKRFQMDASNEAVAEHLIVKVLSNL